MPDEQSQAALLALAQTASLEREKRSFWKKLKRGLLMTHTEVIERVNAAVQGRAVLDEEVLEYLEETLIATDIGVETALHIVETVRRGFRPGETRMAAKLREVLTEEVARLLLESSPPASEPPTPRVTLLVGVNGVGKTTSMAKLARRSQARGELPLLVAADTFRAAAIEQVEIWAERLGVGVVRQKIGGDPAAVLFDGLAAAKARGVDHLIADTAGRFHTKDNLMAELAKMGRILDREGVGWSRQTLLVLDATTGQNAVQQAREFTRIIGVDGVLLTKLDGTARGGVVVAIARELGLPVRYLGVGEGADDLIDFRAREFAAALFA